MTHSLRILVVGGTGMIGRVAARHLAGLGHRLSVAARTMPRDESEFPVVIGDYVTRSFTAAQLEPFDAILFAAGQDVRHVGASSSDESVWRETQSEGVPAFARLARDAGVRRFVQIGSYYHVVRPDLALTTPYVRARQVADQRSRALATGHFNILTINPPSVVGAIAGASLNRYRRVIDWARGRRPDLAFSLPPGGTNYMSARSLAEAVATAFDRGEPGRAYLVGDANLSFREYYQQIFRLAGSSATLDERDAPHAMLPDNFLIHGRGQTLAYDPPEEGLAYGRDDVARALAEIIAMVDEGDSAAASVLAARGVRDPVPGMDCSERERQ